MSTTTTTQLKRYDWTQGPRKIGPRDGKFVQLMSVGVRFMAWGEETGGGFSLVEHPIAPKTLAAPVHIHEKEDEYSYVLEGRLGALLGDEVIYADPGELVFKPRKQWHTFWNAGETECRILEIISPSGFEHFFEELAELLAQGGLARPDHRARRTIRPLLRPREDRRGGREARPALPDAGGRVGGVSPPTGLVSCVTLDTGALVWQRDLYKDAKGCRPEWGYAGSPLVLDGKVIVSSGKSRRR